MLIDGLSDVIDALPNLFSSVLLLHCNATAAAATGLSTDWLSVCKNCAPLILDEQGYGRSTESFYCANREWFFTIATRLTLHRRLQRILFHRRRR